MISTSGHSRTENTRTLNRILVAAVVVVLVSLYWYGAVEHLHKRNTDMTATDQRGYLNQAKSAHEWIYEGQDFQSNRARMPVYPFIQSFFYHPSLTNEAYFVRGKYLNIALSLAILTGVTFILKRYLSLLPTVTLTLVAGFTVFVFKAAYFHAALLFYFLNFCVFLLLIELLIKPSWKLGVLTGIVIGVAYLTKAAMLPALGLFLIFSLAKAGWLFYTSYIGRKNHTSLLSSNASRPVVHLFCVALVVLSFLSTVYDYISTNKRVFGRYFYNVSTTFYMWYDSWEEVRHGTRAHGDRKGWPDMPSEEIPSPGKYLREHTLQQIGGRFVSGLKRVHSDCSNSYGYYKYVAIYTASLLLLLALNLRYNARIIVENVFVVLFCLSFFVVYLLGYAWYSAVSAGPRFVLAQFLPYMFSVFFAISRQPSRGLLIRPLGIRANLSDVLHVLVLSILAVDTYFILTHRVVTMYAGR